MILTWFLPYSPNALYFLPFFPCIVYIFLLISVKDVLTGTLSSDERDTDRNRTVIGLMAGFAFAGITAISVLKNEQKVEFGLEASLYYLVISFLCYLVAINLEAYKFFVYLSILGDLLVDIADLSLLCCVLSFVFIAGYSERTKWLILGFVTLVWLLHYFYLIKCHSEALQAIRVRLKNS